MARCRSQWPLCCQTDLTKTRSHHCNVPLNPCASTNQQCTWNVLQAPAPNQQMVGNLVGVVQLEGLQPLPWLKLLRSAFLPHTPRRLKPHQQRGAQPSPLGCSRFSLVMGMRVVLKQLLEDGARPSPQTPWLASAWLAATWPTSTAVGPSHHCVGVRNIRVGLLHQRATSWSATSIGTSCPASTSMGSSRAEEGKWYLWKRLPSGPQSPGRGSASVEEFRLLPGCGAARRGLVFGTHA